MQEKKRHQSIHTHMHPSFSHSCAPEIDQSCVVVATAFPLHPQPPIPPPPHPLSPHFPVCFPFSCAPLRSHEAGQAFTKPVYGGHHTISESGSSLRLSIKSSPPSENKYKKSSAPKSSPPKGGRPFHPQQQQLLLPSSPSTTIRPMAGAPVSAAGRARGRPWRCAG